MGNNDLTKKILLLSALCFFCSFSHSSDLHLNLSSSCFKALKPAPNCLSISDEYQPSDTPAAQSTLLPQPITQWLEDNNWDSGYELWRNSLACHSGIQPTMNGRPLKLCELEQAPIAPVQQSLCQNKSAAIDYLAVHKHLIQSRKTLWPRVVETFSSWEKFPQSEEDYSKADAQWFYPWPDQVLENAQLVDMLGKISHQELLTRWPTEQDFAHWLICGSNGKGEQVNAIASALHSNVTPLEGALDYGAVPLGLKHPVFWKNIAWLDRAWDRYRMRIGKTPYDPDLQANVLKQCQKLDFWISEAKKRRKPTTDKNQRGPLFVEGQLNPLREGTMVRLLGELIELRVNKTGHVYALLRLNKYGAKPLWVTSSNQLSKQSLIIGKPYIIVGRIALAEEKTRALLDRPEAVLLVNSLQTPK